MLGWQLGYTRCRVQHNITSYHLHTEGGKREQSLEGDAVAYNEDIARGLDATGFGL